jgi:threonine synthase
VGAGSLALGCSIGFNELRRSGAIEHVPRLLLAQPENVSPLAHAFKAGDDAVTDATWEPTIAEGTAITRPVRDKEVLAAVRESDGVIVAVPEAEIGPAVRRLAAHGLYTEPTGAIVIAALPRLPITPGQVTVTVLTGSGLKSPATMARILG